MEHLERAVGAAGVAVIDAEGGEAPVRLGQGVPTGDASAFETVEADGVELDGRGGERVRDELGVEGLPGGGGDGGVPEGFEVRGAVEGGFVLTQLLEGHVNRG